MQIPQGIESCEKGCRLYLLIDGAVKSEDPSAEDTLKNCKHSKYNFFCFHMSGQ